MIHLLNEIDHEIEVTSHDVANRTHGLVARTRSLVANDGATDAVIVARVRSKLGHVVSHPRAIVVTARGGQVTLSGPALAGEVDRLLSAVRSVRGVTGVEDRLRVYERPGDHPALQGGTPRGGERPDLRRETWSPAMRLIAVTAIGSAVLRVAGPGRLACLAFGALGGGLIARGLASEGRGADHSRSLIATGAPVHDVAIPFARPRGAQLDTIDPAPGLKEGRAIRDH